MRFFHFVEEIKSSVKICFTLLKVNIIQMRECKVFYLILASAYHLKLGLSIIVYILDRQVDNIFCIFLNTLGKKFFLYFLYILIIHEYFSDINNL